MESFRLINLQKKKSKLVIGLMSGTSLDGVDCVLCSIKNSAFKTEVKQINFITHPFPNRLKEILLENSIPHKGNVTDITKLNFLLSFVYVDAIKKLIRKSKINMKEIDLIGSHGQTIQHLPGKEKYFNYKFGSTLQIGDPSIIAKLTGVTTIGDFRTGDMALGGEGAPLVPYFDYIMLMSKKNNRALLNVGGISNITILKKNGKPNDILAFDTGPGNILIDSLSKKMFNADYDKDGEFAEKGNINEKLMKDLIRKDNFILSKPPKSTGREYYNEKFIQPLLNKFNRLPRYDLVATITNFTAYAVYRNYELFVKNKVKIDKLYVSGGGARNKFLLKQLQYYFGKSVKVFNIEKIGISSDAKEAICFAVLANETISGNPSNLPKVTGAKRKTILGKICLP
jgi:anhydro-N-acetylmuramic acid kinase